MTIMPEPPTRAAAAVGGHASSEEQDISVNDCSNRSDLQDPEKQGQKTETQEHSEKVSAFKSLGWLDRFLAVWILLAMIVGVLLGNFVPETGPALQKGKFVGVSIPIGMPAPSPTTMLSILVH